jgi:hypothetical protein
LLSVNDRESAIHDLSRKDRRRLLNGKVDYGKNARSQYAFEVADIARITQPESSRKNFSHD